MIDAESFDRYGVVNRVNVTIGKFTYGFSGVKIHNWDHDNLELKIGSFCSIGSNLNVLMSGEHKINTFTTYPFNHPKFLNELGGDGVSWKSFSKGNIVIQDDVWIGFNCTILSGVTIGYGAIIGANSVVTKNVEPYTIVAGNPAKIVRKRFDDDIVKSLLNLKWWDLDVSIIKDISDIIYNNTPSIELVESLCKKYR